MPPSRKTGAFSLRTTVLENSAGGDELDSDQLDDCRLPGWALLRSSRCRRRARTNESASHGNRGNYSSDLHEDRLSQRRPPLGRISFAVPGLTATQTACGISSGMGVSRSLRATDASGSRQPPGGDLLGSTLLVWRGARCHLRPAPQLDLHSLRCPAQDVEGLVGADILLRHETLG